MANISIKNLTFGYSSDAVVFENVSINMDTDWKLGLVGRNGKGKTTLLRLLNGEYEYRGRIDALGEFEYFPFAVEESLTVEEISNAYFYDVPTWKITRELNLLGFNGEIYARAYNTLSKGEQTRIMLAILFAKDNAFLLIDEPTNHLDADGRCALSKYLQNKKGFILISHDSSFLDDCVDHILSINKESIEICAGNYTTYLENKQNREDYERKTNSRIESQIDKLSKASKKTSEWSDKLESTKIGGGKQNKSGIRPDRGFIGAKSAKLMKRAKAIEGRIETDINKKSKLLREVERTDGLKIFVDDFRTERLITIKDLVIRYDNKSINAPISFDINRGDRIAICGRNGSGKTSIIQAIKGDLKGYDGEIVTSGGVTISFCPQDPNDICGTLADICAEYNLDKTLLTTILYKFGLEKEQFTKRVEEYSLGQKKKLTLAKSLCERANLYIWDEPLNYIDIVSRKQIEDAIINYKPTMIFIEHDKSFCDAVATKKVVLV